MKRTMKRSVAFVLVACAVALGPQAALGWGDAGHRVVGEIAWNHLNEPARKEVARLLALDDQYDSLAGCCTWADAIRRDRSYRWANRLHYVNLPKGATGYDAERDCKPKRDCPAGVSCPPADCVVSGISHYAGVLADKTASDTDKLIALKFVGHFIGDLHQPLHAGYARDRGGNDVRVEFFHDSTNLHKVWDTLMIRKMGRWTDLAASLDAPLSSEDGKASVKKWSSDLDPGAWAYESHLLVEQLYTNIPKSGIIGEAYQTEHTPLLKSQLQKAGVRLAATLNRALAK